MSSRMPDLDAAYALQTPEDNISLYADWAKNYDSGFAVDMDYQLPKHVASMFLKIVEGAETQITRPILDVGAGTGLLVEHLVSMWGKRPGVELHGLDISAEMLAVAKQKGHYHQMIEADLSQPLPLDDDTYAAIVSSGTFTHGHVGPDALDELLRVSRPGAVFAISVNAQYFIEKGFAAKFSELDPLISGFRIHTVHNYGDAGDDAHSGDLGHIATFKKL